jgi:hypothetical protein
MHNRCETESALNINKTDEFSAGNRKLQTKTASFSDKSDDKQNQQHSSSSFDGFPISNPLVAQMHNRNAQYPVRKQAANFFATSDNLIQSSHTEEKKESR